MECQVILVTYPGTTFDLAGHCFSSHTNSDRATDSSLIDGCAVSCQLDLEPMVIVAGVRPYPVSGEQIQITIVVKIRPGCPLVPAAGAHVRREALGRGHVCKVPVAIVAIKAGSAAIILPDSHEYVQVTIIVVIAQ